MGSMKRQRGRNHDGQRRRRGDGLRRCLGCGKTLAPSVLLRLTVSGEAELKVDVARKMGGRGAHVCYHGPCIEAAFRKRRLARLLRVKRLDAKPDVIVEQAREQLLALAQWRLSRVRLMGKIVTRSSRIVEAMSAGDLVYLVVVGGILKKDASLLATALNRGIPIYKIASFASEGLSSPLEDNGPGLLGLRLGATAASLEQVLKNLVGIPNA